MSLKIGIDIDGVLADFTGHFNATYSDWFNAEAPTGDGTFDGIWKGSHFENLVQAMAWVQAVPGFWRGIKPVRGAQGGLYRLSTEQGHDYKLISNRADATRLDTQAWLATVLPASNLTHTVHLVPSGLKGSIDCQVYIEDSPKELESLRHKPCVLIFDQPWNKDVKADGGMHRVRGWNEVLEFLHNLEHGSEVPFMPLAVQKTAQRVAKAGVSKGG